MGLWLLSSSLFSESAFPHVRLGKNKFNIAEFVKSIRVAGYILQGVTRLGAKKYSVHYAAVFFLVLGGNRTEPITLVPSRKNPLSIPGLR